MQTTLIIIVVLGVGATLFVQSISLERRIKMALKDDLNAAVATLKANQAAQAQAINDEIARVNATIAALQAGQSGGSVDDATVQQAITDLTTVATNLGASTAQLTAEDPAAPAPAPAPASSTAASGSSGS